MWGADIFGVWEGGNYVETIHELSLHTWILGFEKKCTFLIPLQPFQRIYPILIFWINAQ